MSKKIAYLYKDDSLIRKARSFTGKKMKQMRKMTQADIDLAYAYASGEVTGKQLCQALGIKYSSSYAYRFVCHAVKSQVLGL